MNETDIEIIRAMDLPEYEGNPKDAKMLVTTPEGVKQMSGEAYPQLDTTTAAEGDIPVVGEGGNLVGSGIKAENIAQKDGYYAQMTAGAAENLVGQTPDKEAYLIRPTGGEGNEVANGIASVVGIEGNSCVWNQLVNSDTTSVILMSGRKYYTKIDGTAAVVSGAGSAVSVTGGVDMVIDLTLLGIDNLTTVAQVEAWLAQHPGTKPYYAYNAGEILNAKMIGMRTVGRNLLNPETKQATLIPYTWEDNSNVFIVKNVPSGATATFTPDATGEAVSVDVSGGSLDITNYGSGVLELSAATADTYVCFKWDGTKDNDVVPHVEHSYAFDTRKVYGKVNGQGEYVQCYPNGMKSAGSVHDVLMSSEAIVRTQKVSMASLNWIYSGGRFLCYLPDTNNTVSLICSKYAVGAYGSHTADDKIIYPYNDIEIHQINVRDSSYSDVSTFKAAMQNEYIVYRLNDANTITYTDLVYRDNGVDTPLSEVLINMEVDNWGIEQQLVTPYVDGNPTSVPATLSTIFSMDAVEAIDTLQKTTYTEAEVHDNLAALLACVNTNCSEVLGGTFAVSDTATDKVFEFTFTPNPEPSDNSNDNSNE